MRCLLLITLLISGLLNQWRVRRGTPRRKGKTKRKSTGGLKRKQREIKIKGKSKGNPSGREKNSSGCFICDGPLRAKEYRKKGKLNALVAEADPLTNHEEEEAVHLNLLQLFNRLIGNPHLKLMGYFMLIFW